MASVKTYGIEVFHGDCGWEVRKKYSRDYYEILANCPNPDAAEEIAKALRAARNGSAT